MLPNVAVADVLALLDATQDALWLVAHDFSILFSNSAASRQPEAPQRSTGPASFLELIPVAERPRFRDHAHKARELRAPASLQIDEGARQTRYTIRALEDEGSASRYTICGRDVTEERRIASQSRENESRLRRYLGAGSAGTWEWDLRTDENVWSQELWQLYGLDPQRHRASFESWLLSVDDEQRELAKQTVRDAAERGVMLAVEWRVAGSTPERWLYSQGQPERDAQGAVARYLGLVLDITERKLQEQALSASRAKLDTALAALSDAVLVTDARGEVLDFNDAFARIHRFASKADCPSRVSEYARVLECFLPDGSLASLEQWAIPRALRGEKRENVEYTLRRIDTGETWIGSYSFAPIRDEAGAITGSVMVGRDVTDLKRAAAETAALEARLQQSQRLEAVGRLAGGIAHDFNNMLHVIVGNTELALEQVAQADSQVALALHEISSVAKRSTALVRQLLAFARRQSIAPRVMDLNVTIQGMLQMLGRLLGEHIELCWTPGKSLWPVRIDPSQLDQILVNLCVNARDAVTQGTGRIAIETRNVAIDEAARALLPELNAGDYVRLSVSDNGSGMDAATISSLFEPFFTTKPLGEGTGLGLSTVYGAVKQHGGVLSVQSTPGGGSTFTIHLPRDPGAVEVVSLPPAPLATPADNAETILLVEDEPSVLRMTERMLRKCGYSVLTATSPSEALSVARARPSEISALVSDVMMPQMTGIELARELSAILPQLKTLFISGYAEHLQGSAAPGEHFLQKPYSTDALLKALRRVLDEGAPQPLPETSAARKPA